LLDPVDARHAATRSLVIKTMKVLQHRFGAWTVIVVYLAKPHTVMVPVGAGPDIEA
jgi:hypothetical protein